MKKIYAIISLLGISLGLYAQDAIIYRDGRVKEVKIIQTNNDKTLFKEAGNKHAVEEYVDNKQVFMLKFKTRGNVVFNANGERILTTSERIQIPKDAIVVYYYEACTGRFLSVLDSGKVPCRIFHTLCWRRNRAQCENML